MEVVIGVFTLKKKTDFYREVGTIESREFKVCSQTCVYLHDCRKETVLTEKVKV
jgi:hypothetical protein